MFNGQGKECGDEVYHRLDFLLPNPHQPFFFLNDNEGARKWLSWGQLKDDKIVQSVIRVVLSYSWSSVGYSARAQSRGQINGPVTPQLNFFTCRGPSYWNGDTLGDYLEANTHDLNLPPPLQCAGLAFATKVQLGWKTTKVLILSWWTSFYLPLPDKPLSLLISSPPWFLFPSLTFPFPQSLINSCQAPTLCQVQAGPWGHGMKA